MPNILSTDKQIEILKLLVEGNSIRSTVRLTGCHKKTVTRLMVTFGAGCRTLLDREMRGLTLKHLECDEIWTFVQKKQSRLTMTERALRSDIGDIYLWTALDQETKLIPTFAIGKRSADNARKFMVDLAGRLTWPDTRPHTSDAHAFRPEGYRHLTQISTDGFPAYPEAVDLAFGPFAKFGTIIKEYKNATMAYTPSEMVGTKRRGIQGIGEGETNTICTSHVERNNLTIRTFMKRFTRLALGFSKKLENLESAVALHIAYYNFCWRPGKLRVTPAMAAGVTPKLWWMENLFEAVTQSRN
jgi:IS1 family transposase